MSPGRTLLSASSPAQPRPAVPPCAPTRAARGMSGFWTRQVTGAMGALRSWLLVNGPTPFCLCGAFPPFHAKHVRELLLLLSFHIQRFTTHTTTILPKAWLGPEWRVSGGAVRRRGGAVPQGTTSFFFDPQNIENKWLGHFFGSTDKGNPIYTESRNTMTGLRQVDKQVIGGTTAAHRPGLLTNGQTFVCLCKSLS